jgi:hypothetical protein
MRYGPLFLLSILIQFPLILSELSLYVQKANVRKIAKYVVNQGVAESELTAISTSQYKQEIQWEKPNEIALHGSLYDVVRTETCPGDTIYYCWQDVAESRIKKQLESIHQQFWSQNPARQEQQSKVWSFFQQLFFQQRPENMCISPGLLISSPRLFPGEEFANLDGVKSTHYTPPEILA